MSPRAKVRAGGILRTSIDTTWETPDFIVDHVRKAFGDLIPFDPASALDNPTRADRYCAGPPGRLFAGAPSLKCVTCAGELAVREVPHTFARTDETTCERCDLASKSGLEVSWDWPWWCNPPFKPEWIRKIALEAARVDRHEPGIALFPCNRQEESFFHDAFSRAAFVLYVNAEPFQRGVIKSRPRRVAFISSRDRVAVGSNPFATMLLGFNFPEDHFAELAPLGPIYKQERLR